VGQQDSVEPADFVDRKGRPGSLHMFHGAMGSLILARWIKRWVSQQPNPIVFDEHSRAADQGQA
jgi:hypothetical protein